MKPTRRHLDDIFGGVRNIQPKEPLCSADELYSVINTSVDTGRKRVISRFSRSTRMAVAASLLVASIAAGVFFLSSDDDRTAVSEQGRHTETSTIAQPRPVAPSETSSEARAAATELQISPQAASAHVDQTERANMGRKIAVNSNTDVVPASVIWKNNTIRPALESPMKIRGLRFLDLSDAELERLGIVHTPSGYELAAQEIVRYDDHETRLHMTMTRKNNDNMSLEFHKSRFKEFFAAYFGGDTTEPVATLKYRICLDTFSTACQPIRYPAANMLKPFVSPLIISQDYYRNANDEGRLVVTFENPLLLDSISKFSRQVFEMYTSLTPDSSTECRDITKYSLLSKLVPVRIHMGAVGKKSVRTPGSDIILWYYPSREFLEALPQDLADRLRIELGFTTLVEEGVLHAEELKKRYCGEYNYLDVCRTKDGAISISSIVPNPASDRTMVKVHVTERRNFTVSLHDMSGNRVAHLTNLQLLDSDVVTIDVSDKPAGTYLIAITSDRGEQVVERLIVSR